MGRIVVNKHFDVKSNITPESFAHKGEIIISNQVGFEGIFIKNNNGDIFYIAPTEGTGVDVPLEYKEYIESFINGRLEGYITQEEFDELIKNKLIDPAQVKVIANEEIASALTVYSTTEEVNAAIEQAVSAIKIPSLEGYATEGFVTQKIAEVQLEIPTEAMRQVAAEEIVKIVNSADSRYDTLKEISDWILSDTTGAASMANDITYLKTISADTRLSIIESGLTNVEAKISGLTSEDIYDKDSNKTQAEINQIVLQGSSESSKHFFMSTEEYATLLADGKVIIDGTEIVYDENAFYALYEPEE